MKMSLTENIDLYADLDLDIRKDSSTSTGLITTTNQATNGLGTGNSRNSRS